jgi:SAM-dependent methyltransferase
MDAAARAEGPPGKAWYGIDAPGVQLGYALGGGALAVLGSLARPVASGLGVPALARLGPAAASVGVTFVATAALMLWGSLRGKLRMRDRIIASIPWRGDEQVLDVGCGHGLMLLAAARKLATGRAVGVDPWRTLDQAGNSRGATLRNAAAEGVAERVDLHDGDARALPFGDAAFDVALSSFAIHNISSAEGREQAVREVVRVLKPGGRAVIADIRHAADYARVFRQAGMASVAVSGPSFIFFIPSRVVSAVKPA